MKMLNLQAIKALATTLLLVMLSSSFAFSAHPKSFMTEVDGTAYSCRPANEAKYCPLLTLDVALGVMIRLGRTHCLRSLSVEDANLSHKVGECFMEASQRKFYEDLLLYDVPLSCLKKNLEDCMEYSSNCSGVGPCGKLGIFVKELRDLNLPTSFNKADGEALCRKMLNL